MINRDAASETRTHDSTGKHTDALIRSATATPFICIVMILEVRYVCFDFIWKVMAYFGSLQFSILSILDLLVGVFKYLLDLIN